MKSILSLYLLISAPAMALEIQGHRGARWWRPENTMSAFRYALELGADTLEMDLHATKDNVLVVTHDPYLNPDVCLDAEGKKLTSPVLVRSLTVKELQKYDCGSLVNPRFPHQLPQPKERIPTFEEVLRWLEKDRNPRARKVFLNVETKSEEAHPEFTPNPEEFTKMVLELVRKHKLGKRFTLQSFDYRTLKEARKLDPKIRISALVEFRPPETLVKLAKNLQADIVSPDYQWLTKKDVENLHKVGVKVIPWTPNDPESWKKLVEMGVDGLISDDTKNAVAFKKALIK